jgi:hypothetical protein
VQTQNILLEHLKALILTLGCHSYRKLWIAVEHRGGNRTPQPNMNLSHARLFDDARGIVMVDAATSHDRDTSARGLNQPGNLLNGLQRGFLSA